MIITHASRLKDYNHTSFAEIQSFKEILESHMIFRYVEIKDYQELESTAFIGDMTIFAAGKDMHSRIVELANSCKNLYVVVQDPNWPTSLRQIKREFTLVTPFKALENLELKDALKALKKEIPTISTKYIKSHKVVDFGSMLAYNKKYANRYQQNVQKSEVWTVKDWPCYIGSLKQDRIDMLTSIAKKSKVTFFGNFTREDFVKMNNSNEDFKHCAFVGRISPFEVVDTYREFSKVIFCPDDKIVNLDTSYLRIAEMCLAESKPIIVTNRKEISKSLDIFRDFTGRLKWTKFLEFAKSRNLIEQIKEMYKEVL